MPLKISKFVRCALAGFAALMLPAVAAHAVSIELKDEAPDRIERQRTAAMGNLPLPGTPDIAKFAERLAAKGMKPGLPVYLRIFKSQSELEVWMEKDGTYQLFDTYPICHWSGTLGPKTAEGDKQTPEGFYTVTSRQLHRMGRWHQALNLGFPNAYDESLKRDGSYILVHGGCSSVGCFAMTNPVIEEIFTLTSAALKAGQRHVPVHVFPFRMKESTLAKYEDSEWHQFWTDLKAGYDSFERTKRPPQVTVCKGRYLVQDAATSPLEAGAQSPLAVCGPTAAELLNSDKSAWLVPLPTSKTAQSLLVPAPPMVAWPVVGQLSTLRPQPDTPQPDLANQPQTPQLSGPLLQPSSPQPEQTADPQPSKLPVADAMTLAALRSPEQFPALTPDKSPEPGTVKGVASINPELSYEYVPRLVAPQPKPGTYQAAGVREKPLPCSLSLPSCRRYASLLAGRSSKQRALARAHSRRSGSVASR
jgi:murein L,D-transpeptidase YafK